MYIVHDKRKLLNLKTKMSQVRNPLTESIEKPGLTPVKNKSTNKVSQGIS